jgi:2,3-bisphosphoglycerate-dependent phosphoglycerate mutase
LTTTIVLVRHGETDWNREHRFQGHADPPLNEAGRAQARELARTLAAEPFERAYTSPLRRALETAEIVTAGRAIAVEPDPSLLEVDVGSWSGLTVADVEARFPEAHQRWLETRSGWEDGETHDELGRRVLAGLVALGGRHPAGHLLAVTHGGPIRCLAAALRGLPFDAAREDVGYVANCGVLRIAVRDGDIATVD